MNYPKITIVTPCFNHERYVGETIESVVSQGYPNLQYIVVNDGSTDASGEVIHSFEKYISHLIELDGHRSSPVSAINQGFALAEGEILGWINSDDILLPKSLFTIAKVFTDLPHVEWLTGLGSTINCRGEIVNCQARRRSRYDYLCGNWKVIQQESTFFRKSLWSRAGAKLDEEYLEAFDTELWTRLFSETTHFELQAPLGAFRNGQQSRTIRDIEGFYLTSLRALDRMKCKASPAERFIGRIYGLLRAIPVRPFLGLIPEACIRLTPLHRFSDSIIFYDSAEDRWLTETRSAFRR